MRGQRLPKPRPYRGHPPAVAGDETSEEAADSIASDASRLRGAVRTYILKGGEKGRTCDEVEVGLGMRHQTASARIRELFLMDRINKRGDKRKTRSGRQAWVWRVEKAGRE